MSVLKPSFVLLIFLCLSSQFLVTLVLAQAREAEAASALATSEDAVSSAYQAVSNAADVGADVSSLLVRLNEAGWFLSRARIEYELGNFDSVLEYATQCQGKLNGFIADADALRERTIYEHYMDFSINVAASVVGAVSVVCVSFFVWLFLKKKTNKTGSVV